MMTCLVRMGRSTPPGNRQGAPNDSATSTQRGELAADAAAPRPPPPAKSSSGKLSPIGTSSADDARIVASLPNRRMICDEREEAWRARAGGGRGRT
jgi:hypothetical protein